MAFLAGANNAVLINNCQNLSNLTVQLQVTEDLITLEDTGFSVQLNCYPQIGAITPNSTQGTTFPGEVVGQLEWFQYVLNVTNNNASFEIQYWAHAKSYQDAGPGGNPPEIRWPPGYTPNPLNTKSLASGVPRHRGNRQRRLGLLEQDSCRLGDNHRPRDRQQRQRDRGDVQHRRSERQRSIGQHAAVVRLRRSGRTGELRPLSDLRLSARSCFRAGLAGHVYVRGRYPDLFGVVWRPFGPNHQHMRWYPTRHSRKLQHRLPGRHASVRLYGQPVLRRPRDEHEFLFRQVDLWPG